MSLLLFMVGLNSVMDFSVMEANHIVCVYIPSVSQVGGCDYGRRRYYTGVDVTISIIVVEWLYSVRVMGWLGCWPCSGCICVD